jgi:ribosomal protein L32
MDEDKIIKYAIGYLQEAIKALQEDDIDTGGTFLQLAGDELEKILTAAQQKRASQRHGQQNAQPTGGVCAICGERRDAHHADGHEYYA